MTRLIPLTVVIPCYGRQEKLARAVDSVLIQPVLPQEIIIVDDGSPLPLKLPELKNLSCHIRIIRLPVNSGAAEARNVGLQASKTDWVSFLDSDDWLLPNTMQLRWKFVSEEEMRAPVKGRTVYGCGWQDTLINGMLHAFYSARKKVSSLRLLFIGPDESNGAIERLKIKEPEIFVDVIDLGLVKNHEEYLLVSDVLCMPSYREGFGSIVIDAAALGVPCIGSRISGLVDSVSDGKSGFLFNAGDVVELEKIIVRLESDRKLLSIMGRAATERVKNYFSSQILYRHLKNFYESQL